MLQEMTRILADYDKERRDDAQASSQVLMDKIDSTIVIRYGAEELRVNDAKTQRMHHWQWQGQLRQDAALTIEQVRTISDYVEHKRTHQPLPGQRFTTGSIEGINLHDDVYGRK